MSKLYVSPEAKSDLHSIKEYIAVEFENPIAAANTISKITKAMRKLVNFPTKGTPLSSITSIPNDYRFLICGNYLVFYRCENNAVYIVRIVYGKRDYLKILFGSIPENDIVQ